MILTPEVIKADYRRLMNERGETVAVRRYTGAGTNRPKFDANVMAVVTGFAPKDLVGTILQGDRKAIILAEDLIEAQMPLPVTTSDKLVVRGKELQIIAADDSTRRVSGTLVAYELQIRG